MPIYTVYPKRQDVIWWLLGPSLTALVFSGMAKGAAQKPQPIVISIVPQTTYENPGSIGLSDVHTSVDLPPLQEPRKKQCDKAETPEKKPEESDSMAQEKKNATSCTNSKNDKKDNQDSIENKEKKSEK